MNKLKTIFAYTLGGIVLLGVVALAGSLIPETSPAPTMYTLSDIYNKINSGTPAGTHTISTTTTPNNSMVTLGAIYDSIPERLQLSDSSTAVPYGIYATTTLDTIDTDLISANIATGTNIFGIQGTGPRELEWSPEVGGMTWSEATEYCSLLELNGHTDWRLPKQAELLFALANSMTEDGFDGTGLPGFTNRFDTFWSSELVNDDNYSLGATAGGPSDYMFITMAHIDSEAVTRCVR